MAWIYEQKRGWMYRDVDGDGLPDGERFEGYAGHGEGKNNPDLVSVRSVGPIPAGGYCIGTPIDHPRVGFYAMPLTPDPSNQMFGRSAFYIHGDSRTAPGTASLGCIILPRTVREAIWKSGDRQLVVVPGAEEH